MLWCWSLRPDIVEAQYLKPTPAWEWVTDDTVRALTTRANWLYLGGDFDYLGPRTGALAVLTPQDGGQAERLQPLFNGIIRCMASDGAGGWFVGGEFDQAGGHKVQNLAHVLASGRIDPNWVPLANAPVHALQLVGKKLLVGGKFTLLAGLNRPYLGMLDARTGLPEAWTAGDLDAPVFALAVRRNLLFLGGAFTRIGAERRRYLAGIHLERAEVLSWQHDPNAEVRTLFLKDNVLYVGGSFARVNGQARHCLAALDALTGSLTDWAPRLTDKTLDYFEEYATVNAITGQGNVIVVGGELSLFADGRRNGLVWLDATTGRVIRRSGDFNGEIWALHARADRVWAGGEFTRFEGYPRRHVVAFSLQHGTVSDWPAETNGSVYSLTSDSVGLWVGGHFTSAGGRTRHRLGAVNTTTGRVTDWNPNYGGDTTQLGSVFALLCIREKDLWVGGTFRELARKPVAYLGAVTSQSGEWIDWQPGPNGPVLAFAQDRKSVYLGGSFTEIMAADCPRLAAFELSTGAWDNGFRPQADASVTGLFADQGQLYVTGRFRAIGGLSAAGLAVLNPRKGLATAGWSYSPLSQVQRATGIGTLLLATIKDRNTATARLEVLDNRTLKPFSFPNYSDLSPNVLSVTEAEIVVARSSDPSANSYTVQGIDLVSGKALWQCPLFFYPTTSVASSLGVAIGGATGCTWHSFR
jgi:hypothetical protein